MALVQRFHVFRRDVSTVFAELRGNRPPPFHKRGPLARHQLASTAMVAPRSLVASRPLRVTRVVQETADAVSLWLSDPEGRRISFEPGQFFTVLVTLSSGEVLRRAYSVSSTPDDDGAALSVRITIKRVADGRVSNHLNDTAREGDVIEVLGPSGSFTVSPSQNAGRHLVLIAGGSGITPFGSIAASVLTREPQTRVSLLFGNRSHKDIIYRQELAALCAKFEGRFTLRHVLSEPADADSEGVAVTPGILDRATVGRELDALTDLNAKTAEFYVCGPEAMMAEVREALALRGVDAKQIHEERFSSPARRHAALLPTSAQPVRIRLPGQPEREVTAAASQTLLEAGLAASLSMPFSCTLGGCGACKVKLISGDIESEEPNCLSEEEKRAGYVLACVTRASSPCAVEVP